VADTTADAATARDRLIDAALVVATIAIGLALRRWGPAAGLPFVVTKYGGSVLWGAMVHGLVALVAGRRSATTLVLAAAIAAAVEASRLVHTPDLDAFRRTTAGALLLGRVFSPWNLVAYGVGIAGAAVIRRRLGANRPSRAAGAVDRFGSERAGPGPRGGKR